MSEQTVESSLLIRNTTQHMVATVVGLTLLSLLLSNRDCAVGFDDLASTWKMAATYQVVPPDAFNFSHPSEWTKWIRRFERFRNASDLEEKSEEAQVNTLIYTMGAEADDIIFRSE